MSRMNFSYEVVSPLSSQPAACSTKLQPPSSAPHRLICDSYTDCASGTFEAVAFEERHGKPEKPRHLAGAEGRLDVLGRAEGR